MKLLLYSDEYFYKQLNDFYSVYDEKDEYIGSDFDRNYADIFHINNVKYINYAINSLDGFRNVTHVIIQKTQFKNLQLMKVLFRIKQFNPDVKTILFMDDDPLYYEVLLSRIASNHLAYVVSNYQELDNLFSNDFNQDLSEYILKKETKKLLKEFRLY